MLLGIALMVGGLPAAAAPVDYLFRNEQVCDDTGEFCLSGTLSYQSNPRLLRLRARVQAAPGPGLLRIRLIGTTRLGTRRFAPLEVRVRGNYSEIINHKMIPDHPDALEWAVDRIEFIKEQIGQPSVKAGIPPSDLELARIALAVRARGDVSPGLMFFASGKSEN